MKIYTFPKLVQKLFPDIVWFIPNRENQVFLTFDDGPHPIYTVQILKILHQHNTRASFFVLAQKALLHPEIINQIFHQGHTVGLHGYDHQSLLLKPASAISAELTKCQKIFMEVTDRNARFFRPPFGQFSPTLVKLSHQLNLQIVLWRIMTYDFDPNFNQNAILQMIKKRIKSGDVIVLHDGHENSHRSVDLVEQLVILIKKIGLQPAPLPQLSKFSLDI
ncbi:MAG: polysaccharide deacetylase family protein [bacterium]|nr:polysaccharide deacetylase family protein [bacterium]